ncbi:MAG: c-type cytochrome [Candidatus Obscuribacterales bacterium]|nr:c-type cytochrome [Candidatus Obscuribacterales bacterium]
MKRVLAKTGKAFSKVLPVAGIVVGLLLTAPLWYGTTSKCPALREPSNSSAEAIPAWSRKYGADCTLCHSAWPRLNRTGYLFRRLGYRMPQEVDAPSKKPGAVPGESKTGYTPTASTPEQIAKGKKVFDEMQCFTCHADGGNVINPSKPIKGAEFLKKYSDDNQIADVIRRGVPGTAMPGYASNRLTDDDLGAMIVYIRSLTPEVK